MRRGYCYISQRSYSVHTPPYCSVVENNFILFYSTRPLARLFKNAIARCQLFARPDTAASARPTREKSLGTSIVFLNRCAVDLRSRKPATTRAYDITSRRKKSRTRFIINIRNIKEYYNNNIFNSFFFLSKTSAIYLSVFRFSLHSLILVVVVVDGHSVITVVVLLLSSSLYIIYYSN